MKILVYLQKIKKHLITFVHLQLFITLISMPILLAWGMPISLLTFAGNFLFSPILTAFLLLSSLIFFCEILHIPNGIFIYLLEQITHWWLWLMQWATHRVLIALALPSLILLLAIPAIALLILHHKKIHTPGKSIFCYSLLMAFSCAYLIYAQTAPRMDTIDCNKGTVSIIHDQKQLIVIDPGFIGRRLSAPSWCEYTLMPFLAKKYGATTIDHLIILQPNRIIFDAILHLLEKLHIKNIYIPYWQGDMPRHWVRSFMQLKQRCDQKGSRLIRLGNKPITVAHLTITALDAMITAHEFQYPCFRVSGTIENQAISVYSAKYSNRQDPVSR